MVLRFEAKRAELLRALVRDDHEIAGREVLETMAGDRAHALGHGLVLLMDTFDTSEGARLLRCPNTARKRSGEQHHSSRV